MKSMEKGLPWRRQGEKLGEVLGVGRPEPIRAAMGPLCAGLVVLAACSSGTKEGGTATLPSAAAATTTTTSDPWAVPSTITPAYVDRVLAELNHIDGNAFRDARAHNAVTPTYLADERAIRADDGEVALQEADLNKYIASRFAEVKPDPGDIMMTVTKILSAPPPCIFGAVAVNFSAVTSTPITYPPWFVALVPLAADALNPTHWALADDGFQTNGRAPDPVTACAH
jgi:hypothetical protein